MEFGPRLAENVLHQALPAGTHVLTIQSQGPGLGYSGSGNRFDRAAPALLVEDAGWQEVAAGLIPFADLIVSECLMLTDGVRFELETSYRANRWDRTVLLLPPLRAATPVIDSDPLIQLFPRCIWADALHTESLTDSPVIKDLIDRMSAITTLPEDVRRSLAVPNARDAAYPIDLLPVADHHATAAKWDSLRQDEDDRIRYYGFWRLFRAASIWGVQMARSGDDSLDTRTRLADAYVQMSAIMLDGERDGDRIVLVGDLTFAEQCAQSACHLIRDGDPAAEYFRGRAEKQLEEVLAVRRAVEANPERVIVRPRYGPFPVRAASR
jgi:hypothetical protein